MLGAHLNATFINSPGNSSLPLGYGDDDGWVSGPGFGGIIGWGFNQNVMLYAGVDGAMLDFRNLAEDDPLPPASRRRKGDYVFGHADIGVRFSFPHRNTNWAPYINTALTARKATTDDFDDGKVVLDGVGLTIGGGTQYFVTSNVALDFGGQITAGEMDRLKVDGRRRDLNGSSYDRISVRTNIGVRFYPPLPR